MHFQPIRLCILSILYYLLLVPVTVRAQEIGNPTNTDTWDAFPIINFNASKNNGQSLNFIPPSPNAAGLGTFGQIPVSHYTGIPNISVPIYTVSYKELSVPISLNYYAGGNKPDQAPGAVGLGWTLLAGGAINRVVRGLPDVENYEAASPYFLYVLNPTEPDDWSSPESLSRWLRYGFYNEDDRGNPDEFVFNMANHSGKFYRHHSGQDNYTLAGAATSFYKIEVQAITNGRNFPMPDLPQSTASSNIPTEPPVADYAYTPNLFKRKMILQVTVTDQQGIKYVFGGDANAVEFTRPGYTNANPSMPLPDTGRRRYYINPVTWMLTSIESPNRYKIKLEYTRGTYVTKVPFTDIVWENFANGRGPVPTVLGQQSTMYNSCYLSRIITPTQEIQFFHSEASQQLQFPTDPYLYDRTSFPNQFYWYQDVARCKTELLQPKKLDSIAVKGINEKVYKRFFLNYTNSTNTRLKLLSLTSKGNYDEPVGMTHTFTYRDKKDDGTPLALPAYLSNQTDHYGFYNGNGNPYLTTDDPNYYRNIPPENFYASKEPNSTYVQAEILTRINYPTGGYTVFEYEPNYYGKKVTTWPFGTIDNTGNSTLMTGGVRIKSITGYSANNVQASKKTYYYYRNYATGGRTSSGVLSYQPTYYETYTGALVPPKRNGYFNSFSYYSGNVTFQRFSSNPIFPLGAKRGPHVSYSEVTEVNEDNSYTVFTYKNHDNSKYCDKQPEGWISDHETIKQFWKEDEGTSMELERGQLLTETVYDAGNQERRSTELIYDEDPARFNKHIRVLTQTANSLNDIQCLSYRYTATLIYTYYPFIKQKISKEKLGGKYLVSTTDYEYDANYRLIKQSKSIGSNQEEQKQTLAYPADMVAGQKDPDGIYNKMVTKGMIGLPIEQSSIVDGTSVSFSRMNYFSPFTDLYAPLSVENQTAAYPIETRLQYKTYDNQGNVVELKKDRAGSISYIWGYNRAFPIAQAKNAPYNQIAFSGFEGNFEDARIKWTNSFTNLALFNNQNTPCGEYCTGVTGNNVAISISSQHLNLESGKTYILSWWQKYGEVDISSSFTVVYNKVIATKGDWQWHEAAVTGGSGDISLALYSLTQGCYIDELKLYPKGSHMTTYNYDPVLGMTSSCDANNTYTYYEYDNHGRLKHVRDFEKNIIKKYCYNYDGDVSPCEEKKMVFARMVYENVGTKSYFGAGSIVVGNVIIRLYADADCTIPFNASNMTVNYQLKNSCSGTTYHTATVNGSSYTVGSGVSLTDPLNATPPDVCIADYSLTAGTGYVIMYNPPVNPSPVYMKLTLENTVTNGTSIDADLVVRTYSDAACTKPLAVSNLLINYNRSNSCFSLPGTPSWALLNGTTHTLQTSQPIQYLQGCLNPPCQTNTICTYTYSIIPRSTIAIVN